MEKAAAVKLFNGKPVRTVRADDRLVLIPVYSD